MTIPYQHLSVLLTCPESRPGSIVHFVLYQFNSHLGWAQVIKVFSSRKTFKMMNEINLAKSWKIKYLYLKLKSFKKLMKGHIISLWRNQAQYPQLLLSPSILKITFLLGFSKHSRNISFYYNCHITKYVGTCHYYIFKMRKLERLTTHPPKINNRPVIVITSSYDFSKCATLHNAQSPSILKWEICQ